MMKHSLTMILGIAMTPPAWADDPCDRCYGPGQSLTEDCYDVDLLAECADQDVPRGLYLLAKWGADERVDDRLLAASFISGVTVRSYWKDIEVADGEYDWSKIDDHFDLAMAEGKGVRLALGTGVYAPTWLLESKPSMGTECTEGTHTTSVYGVETFCAEPKNGDYKEDDYRLHPVPWDGVLHARWVSFLDALVDHLEGADDGVDRMASLDWIAVTGPNSHNGEVSHPEVRWFDLNLQSPVNGKPITVDTELYDALVFSWERALDDFDQRFGARRVHYTLSFIYQSFPLGYGNSGLDEDFKNALEDHGRGLTSAAYFGLQTNGLDDAYSWATDIGWPTYKDHWKRIRNHDVGSDTLTGFQTRGMKLLYGDGDKSSCGRGEVWKTLVTNIKCLQVDFVEVYAPDVASPPDASCGGGVRAELEEVHRWLTE